MLFQTTLIDPSVFVEYFVLIGLFVKIVKVIDFIFPVKFPAGRIQAEFFKMAFQFPDGLSRDKAAPLDCIESPVCIGREPGVGTDNEFICPEVFEDLLFKRLKGNLLTERSQRLRTHSHHRMLHRLHRRIYRRHLRAHLRRRRKHLMYWARTGRRRCLAQNVQGQATRAISSSGSH